MKKFCILLIGITVSLGSFCQEFKLKVEKQIEDPQRKADAGKADVISTKNKNIFDSSTFADSSPAVNKKAVKASGKKKNCRRKKG